jgi:hypothetical protein
MATNETKAAAEPVVAEHVLPLPGTGTDDAAWAERLLVVMRFLEDKHVNVLVGMSAVKQRCVRSALDGRGKLTPACQQTPVGL